jgi:SnoaL-like domain
MEENHVMQAEEYYKLIGEGNAEKIEKHLDSDVEFYSPLATLKGKEAVLEATRNFMNMIKSLKIRAKFGAHNQSMIVYDTLFKVDIPGITKSFPGASLLSFQNGLIVKIELFHDASHFANRMKA